MKYLFAFFLLIFLSSHLSAQEEEKILAACQNFDYSELERVLTDLKKNAPKRYELHTKLDRELVNGFFEQFIELKVRDSRYWGSESPVAFMYEIRLIRKKDGQLAYCKIIRFDAKEDGESIECSRIISEMVVKELSNNTLEDLKVSFQKVYGVQLNFQALFESTIEYGSMCGFSGSPPEYRVKLNKLVKAVEKDSLISWLKSPVAEIQLYAVDGILTLKKSGIKFKKSVLKLIDIVEKKEGTANSCSGCLSQNTTITALVQQMKAYHEPKKQGEKENSSD
ncbi:MAG: hypothetical protein ACO1N0_04875 [Fluviicola sp.]